MAHASNREKGILQMKKYRKAKAKKKMAANLLTKEEKENIEKIKQEKPLKEQVQTAIWDFKHHQYPLAKYNHLKEILLARLKETDVKLIERLDINEVLKRV